jgi:hypothetical protein
MNGAALAGAGATFVGCTAIGFTGGLLLSQRTGVAWFVIGGTFAGLLGGMGLFALLLVRQVQ